MTLIYNLAIALYTFAIRIAAFFNPKARLWIEGRRGLLDKIALALHGNTRPVVWVHCASLGEFEQGRPVIEELKAEHPEVVIVLTFFSPSGYEIRKNYPLADFIFYLPADTSFNARQFIELVKPRLTVIVKYEFWFNYLKALRQQQVPTLIISAIFRPSQHFFKWYGGWFRKSLQGITHFFVQNDSSVQLLKSVGIQQVTLCGDTRFDRVAAIAQHCKPFPLIEQFKGEARLLLAGSSWPADEALLVELYRSNPGLKLILAPHEVHEDHIRQIEKLFENHTLRYSKATAEQLMQAEVLIIDSIGILSHLYQYADLAYIGGAFGKGLHNILEAATFGKPVLFGPNYQKFREAVDLIQLGGAFSIQDGAGLQQTVNRLLQDPAAYKRSASCCSEYVASMQGATARIVEEINRQLF